MASKLFFDVREYINAYGGRKQIINRLRHRFKLVLTQKQVDKWIERNSIPSSYLVVMHILGDEMSPKIDILDYTKVIKGDKT